MLSIRISSVSDLKEVLRQQRLVWYDGRLYTLFKSSLRDKGQYRYYVGLATEAEKAGVADRKNVAEAIREMDTTTGPARFYPGGRLKFDEKGRRVGAALIIVQWHNGEPVVVYPLASALAKPVWSKK